MFQALTILGVVAGSIAAAAAQGTVWFHCSPLSKVSYQEYHAAPLMNAPQGSRIGLFWGVRPDELTLALPTLTVDSNGLFAAATVYSIPGTQPGQQVFIKVAGWDGKVGDDWKASDHYGESMVVLSAPLGRSGGPGQFIWQMSSGTNLNRLRPFTIYHGDFQTIEFPDLPEKVYGDAPLPLSAVASSGMPVTFRSSDPSVAIVEGTNAVITGAGIAVIAAEQTGDSNTAPAIASRALVVRPASAEVALENLFQAHDGTGRVPTAVTAPPGLPVTFTFDGSPTAPTNVGRYAVVATIQARNYAGTTNGVLVIEKGPQVITFAEPARLVLSGEAVTVTATASSGLPVVFTSGDPSVVQVSGNQLIPVAPGQARITASQNGNENYLAAEDVTRIAHVDCRLDLLAVSNGVITASPELTAYPAGSIAVLTATGVLGYGFIRWEGSLSGSENPGRLIMDGNKHVSAVFASTAVSVTVEGRGSVIKEPDLPYYAVGQAVTLRPKPDRWRILSRWTDGNIDNPRVITVGEHNAYTAVFVPETPLEVLTIGDVTREGPVGMPVVWVDGTFTGASNRPVRGSGVIALTSTFTNPRMLYTLDGSEPDFSSILYEGPFVIGRTATIRAVAYNVAFTLAPQADPVVVEVLPRLSAETSGGGHVTIEPSDGAYFPDGTARVTAVAAPGWTFLQWLGDATGTGSVASVRMNRPRCLQAVFGTSIGETAVGGGSIVRSSESAYYPQGETVRFTAVPSPGRYFAFWGSDAIGTNNPLSFLVNDPQPRVTAVFALLPAGTYALTVIPDGFGRVDQRPRGSQFPAGTNVVLTARPAEGQSFLGWTGDASGTSNPLVVPMTLSRTIRARFSKRPQLTIVSCEGAANLDELQLLVTGEYGANYGVEATAFLGDTGWQEIGVLPVPFGRAPYADSIPRDGRQRFYRVVGK